MGITAIPFDVDFKTVPGLFLPIISWSIVFAHPALFNSFHFPSSLLPSLSIFLYLSFSLSLSFPNLFLASAGVHLVPCWCRIPDITFRFIFSGGRLIIVIPRARLFYPLSGFRVNQSEWVFRSPVPIHWRPCLAFSADNLYQLFLLSSSSSFKSARERERERERERGGG